MKAKDLAKLLGVSPATISLVLNNRPGISEPLRRSLLEKIREMGCEDMMSPACREGAAPKALREDACPVIAYLIYDIIEEEGPVYSFLSSVMEGIEIAARDSQCRLVVLHVNQDSDVPLQELLQGTGQVIGLIIQGPMVKEKVLQELEELGLPTVFVDSYFPDTPFSGVCVNNEQGITQAVRYLQEMGHTQIGYADLRTGGSAFVERRRYFSAALRECGLEEHPEYHFYTSLEKDGQSCDYGDLARQFAQAEKMPTALVACCDSEAVQVYTALRHIGLKVPEDVSVVGFDDNFLATMLDPPLTTVKNHRHLLGRECVALLQNLIQLEKADMNLGSLKYEIATKLVIRSSVQDRRQ